MSSNLMKIVEQIHREKGIDPEDIIQAIEEGVVNAVNTYFGIKSEVKALLNKDTGLVELFSKKIVVDKVKNPEFEISIDKAKEFKEDVKEGEEIWIKEDIQKYGRIIAQTVRRIINRKIKEAEKEMLYKMYITKVGEIVSGTVFQIENGNVYLNLEKGQGVIPARELSPRDKFKKGERVKAYLLQVKVRGDDVQLILSRTHPNFIPKLMELEIPEISDKVIEIKDIAREIGEKTKVSIISHDVNIEPVGACVGMKGMRILAVVNELRGENIDVIEYSDDPITYIKKALSPAKVKDISLDWEKKIATVYIDDSQLSLAIGRKGINVKLAANLTHWKIDLVSQSRLQKEKQREKERIEKLKKELTQLPGITESIVDKIIKEGYDTIAMLASLTPKDLMKIQGIGITKAEAIINYARLAYAKAAAKAKQQQKKS